MLLHIVGNHPIHDFIFAFVAWPTPNIIPLVSYFQLIFFLFRFRHQYKELVGKPVVPNSGFYTRMNRWQTRLPIQAISRWICSSIDSCTQFFDLIRGLILHWLYLFVLISSIVFVINICSFSCGKKNNKQVDLCN